MKHENSNSNQEISASEKKTGKWMLVISWLIALTMLTAVFQSWEKTQHNPNQTVNSSIRPSNIVF